ncbi:MAG: hypothetical protein KGP12_07060 [Actinomycetales bacterium]|nr:hypothetical protein [Actinomycetales bacterium]
MSASVALRVVLEIGTRRVFASAIDYPGWARSAKSPDAAVAALLDYQPRYAPIAAAADEVVDAPDEVDVIERLTGNATTDFGAPAIACAAEAVDLGPGDLARLQRLLAACRARFDAVASAAPAELRKGPRGGGRDTDAVVRHVDEVEAAYRRKRGWPEAYAIRRTAWHLTDHLWEIEDRSIPASP